MFISKYNYTTDADLIEYAASLSLQSGKLEDKLLHWDFGPLMNMSYQTEAQNYLFSSEKVPFHWDGAFYREPRKLLFLCLESEGEGGETLFTDTEKIWESLSLEDQEKAKKVTMIYRTEKKAHYGGEIRVPLVQKHPVSGKFILRVAERVETKLNPVELIIEGIEDGEDFYQFLRKKLYSPQYMLAHQWERGDLLICDNFTYLHGRNPLNQNLKRSFKRIQIL
ncbi:MAG: TauD/TfdA family dioxygenase [Bacteriovoracaceae bacterium]